MIELDISAVKRILAKFPDCLDPKEKRVIEMRFGLLSGTKQTLQQIGDVLGISRERIRQIEKRAIRKLFHPARRVM